MGSLDRRNDEERSAWTPLLLALAVGLAAVIGACGEAEPGDAEPEDGQPEAAAVEQDLELTSVTLGSAIGPDDRVIDETTTFRPTDTIYVSIETDGVASAAELTTRWTYGGEMEIDTDRLTLSTDGPEVTEFHASEPDGWRPGPYEVVILLDGREVERLSFTVEGEE